MMATFCLQGEDVSEDGLRSRSGLVLVELSVGGRMHSNWQGSPGPVLLTSGQELRCRVMWGSISHLPVGWLSPPRRLACGNQSAGDVAAKRLW